VPADDISGVVSEDSSLNRVYLVVTPGDARVCLEVLVVLPQTRKLVALKRGPDVTVSSSSEEDLGAEEIRRDRNVSRGQLVAECELGFLGQQRLNRLGTLQKHSRGRAREDVRGVVADVVAGHYFNEEANLGALEGVPRQNPCVRIEVRNELDENPVRPSASLPSRLMIAPTAIQESSHFRKTADPEPREARRRRYSGLYP
jgi:hypothetical protein